MDRREFLGRLGVLAGWALQPPARMAGARGGPFALGPFPDPSRQWHGASSVGFASLASNGSFRVPADEGGQAKPREPRTREHERSRRAARLPDYADLRRHFVFEYYPWYGIAPWYHWDDQGHRPPDDLAATSYPLLGPYDSRDRRVIEQHAKWIAESGVGSVNLSWWGRDSFTDRAVHGVMDVMRAHDVAVTFHIEPYRNDRGSRLADDVIYLIREYGDRRGWDAFLLLEDAAGRSGPVFKLFSTILPPTVTDCLGRTFPVRHYVEDAAWRRQIDRLRGELAHDFDRVLVLADSLNAARVQAAGFNGAAVYDNFVRPDSWPGHAERLSARGLLFSFNVNAGFDAIRPRPEPTDPCWRPKPFEPGGKDYDWSDDRSRAEAMRLGTARIEETFAGTVALQTAPELANARRGFFLVYVNSWNEWHEGTQFEPARPARGLTPAERRAYHNPPVGDYRLRTLQRLIAGLTAASGDRDAARAADGRA